MTGNPDLARRAAFAEQVGQRRRELAGRSLETFGGLYLAHYTKDPPCRLHRDLYERLERMRCERGTKVAVAAPRGSSKSTTVSLIYVLASICFRTEDYIVLISDTASQANDFLSFVKQELETNALLRQDFPEACEEPDARRGPPRWRQDEIITRNGVKVTALGAGKKIRGRRHREHRPSLVILDDVENDENIRSADQREKLREWFHRAVLKAGTPRTNFVVIGTVLHYDSLLATLTDPAKSPGWHGRRYRSVISWSSNPTLWQTWSAIYNGHESHEDKSGPEAARAFFEAHQHEMLEGTEVLWPESESYCDLMVLRETDGPASFDAEKQNEPLDPATCLFQEDWFHFWDDRFDTEEALIAAVGRHGQIIGACDPSLGRAGRRSDYTAIITVFWDQRDGRLYVLDADLERIVPDQIIAKVLASYVHRRHLAFAFETNQFQHFVASELRRRGQQQGLYIPIREVTQTTDKLGRIQTLQPLVKRGTIQFSRRHRLLLEQLRTYPKGSHDDGPDALEMVVRLVEQRSQRRRKLPVPTIQQAVFCDWRGRRIT